jgi:hypothetical protein
MNKIIIIEEGKSNLPLVVINRNTEAIVIDHWVRELIENPNKYGIEVIQKLTFNERCSERFHEAFGGLCAAYYSKVGSLSKEMEIAALFGVLAGFALAEDRIEGSHDLDD